MKYLVTADINGFDVHEYYIFGIFDSKEDAINYIKNNPDPFGYGQIDENDQNPWDYKFQFTHNSLDWHIENSIKEFDGSPMYVGQGYTCD